MKLYIKNMISASCIVLVKDEIAKLGFHVVAADLGEIDIQEDISPNQLAQTRSTLSHAGFGLLEDRKSILVEKIKAAIIAVVYYREEPPAENLSFFLSRKLNYDYTYMSNLFSERLGFTIEKFYICHKIERVKELLSYNELTLTEIALKMHYSSVAHLSRQFKRIAGLTTSEFRQQKDKARIPIEKICS